jgi:hypothetical protein
LYSFVSFFVGPFFALTFLKYGGVGAGDAHAFAWLFTGFLFLSPWLLFRFLFVLLVAAFAQHLILKSLGYKMPYAFFPAIFLSFVFCVFVFPLL